jgi:pilus assembly protein Flp/PilA
VLAELGVVVEGDYADPDFGAVRAQGGDIGLPARLVQPVVDVDEDDGVPKGADEAPEPLVVPGMAYNPGMGRRFRAFLKDESAATAIEYGLIAAGIAVAIITVLKGVGTKLNTTFTSISSALK